LILDGGPGTDSATYEGRSEDLVANLADADANGPDGDRYIDIENLTGGSGANSLTGDAGDNVLTAGYSKRANRLDGGPGDDVLFSRGTRASLSGGSGDDRLYGPGRPSACGLGVDLIGESGEFGVLDGVALARDCELVAVPEALAALSLRSLRVTRSAVTIVARGSGPYAGEAPTLRLRFRDARARVVASGLATVPERRGLRRTIRVPLNRLARAGGLRGATRLRLTVTATGEASAYSEALRIDLRVR